MGKANADCLPIRARSASPHVNVEPDLAILLLRQFQNLGLPVKVANPRRCPRDVCGVRNQIVIHKITDDQNDLVVNPTKAKQLNNIRAAGTDENLILSPPLRYSLEQSLEFLDDDELLEVTPVNLRIRKKLLTEVDRKRESRLKVS